VPVESKKETVIMAETKPTCNEEHHIQEMITVTCDLPEGHEGPHQAVEDVPDPDDENMVVRTVIFWNKVKKSS
jgi:hypothetical protein